MTRSVLITATSLRDFGLISSQKLQVGTKVQTEKIEVKASGISERSAGSD